MDEDMDDNADNDMDEFWCTTYEEIDEDLINPRVVTVLDLPSGQNPVNIPDIHFDKPYFWNYGETLRIGFLGGSPWQQSEVKKYAPEWTKYANLEFEWVNQPPYDITIDFKSGKSFSLIGTFSLKKARASPPKASMNLGWVTEETDLQKYRSAILHEFGHALGRTHEHSNTAWYPWPETDGPPASVWNIPKVYEAYKEKGISEHTVDHNVLAVCTGELLSLHPFDPDSIMLYTIPAERSADGIEIVRKHDISFFDAGGMLARYPGREISKIDTFDFRELLVWPDDPYGLLLETPNICRRSSTQPSEENREDND